jgi:hypothetical protein
MSADQQAMIDQLQAALAQGPQASFSGVTAQPDPNALRTLLSKLQQQQFLQQNSAPTPGPYGYLHDAGKQQMLSVGQALGNQVGTALSGQAGQTAPAAPSGPAFTLPSAPSSATPGDTSAGSSPAPSNTAPPVPIPNPGSTPQASINNMLLAAKAYNQALIKNGTPADQAKVQTLTQLVNWGAPGADTALEAAQAAVLKNKQTQSETAKNTSQAKMDDADTAGKAFDQTTKTWKTTFTDPNGLFLIQTNGQGEQKRVELKPPPSAAAQAAANMDPNSIQFAADTYRSTGKFPGSFARNPAMQAAVLSKVAADAAANGDTAGSIAARSASLKASGAALDQVQKQESFTGSAVQTLDNNLKALQAIGAKVDDSGSPLINKIINHYNQGVVSDPSTAAYVAMLNAVQGEYAKIASNNNGNSPISDSAKADAKDVINKAMSQGGVAAVRQAMMTEAQNRMQAIREAKQGLVEQLSGNAPGAPQNAPRTAQPTPSPTNVVDFASLK